MLTIASSSSGSDDGVSSASLTCSRQQRQRRISRPHSVVRQRSCFHSWDDFCLAYADRRRYHHRDLFLVHRNRVHGHSVALPSEHSPDRDLDCPLHGHRDDSHAGVDCCLVVARSPFHGTFLSMEDGVHTRYRRMCISIVVSDHQGPDATTYAQSVGNSDDMERKAAFTLKHSRTSKQTNNQAIQ